VVGAGAAISPFAVQTAVLVKLGRVAALVPPLVVVSPRAGRDPALPQSRFHR